MKKEIKKALQSAILSAGAFAEQFDNTFAVYPPHLPSGIKSLKRQGREDLIPHLRRIVFTSHRWDVSSLYVAQLVVSDM